VPFRTRKTTATRTTNTRLMVNRAFILRLKSLNFFNFPPGVQTAGNEIDPGEAICSSYISLSTDIAYYLTFPIPAAAAIRAPLRLCASEPRNPSSTPPPRSPEAAGRFRRARAPLTSRLAAGSRGSYPIGVRPPAYLFPRPAPLAGPFAAVPRDRSGFPAIARGGLASSGGH